MFFVEWLVETYHRREFLQSVITYSTLLYYISEICFEDRINSTLSVKIISSFILLLKDINNIDHLLVYRYASGLIKLTNSSKCYTDRDKLRKKCLKLSLAAERCGSMSDNICTIKIRRYPRNDTIDFQPLITKTSEILPLSITVADKGYTVRIIIF